MLNNNINFDVFKWLYIIAAHLWNTDKALSLNLFVKIFENKYVVNKSNNFLQQRENLLQIILKKIIYANQKEI
jgi:hypothetical protein